MPNNIKSAYNSLSPIWIIQFLNIMLVTAMVLSGVTICNGSSKFLDNIFKEVANLEAINECEELESNNV